MEGPNSTGQETARTARARRRLVRGGESQGSVELGRAEHRVHSQGGGNAGSHCLGTGQEGSAATDDQPARQAPAPYLREGHAAARDLVESGVPRREGGAGSRDGAPGETAHGERGRG